MQVEQTTVLDILGMPDARFRIPLYQRVYSWTRNQCDELWEDILRAAQAGAEHFMGTVLARPGEEGAAADGSFRQIDLVDGQQRLVTTTLLLAALSDAAHAMAAPDMQALAAEIDERFLFVRVGNETLTKMELAPADQPTFSALLCGNALPDEDDLSANITNNCTAFKENLHTAVDIKAVMDGLRCLTVIFAQLEEGDEPQSVFESLNSKGKGLSSSDLIRNLLFARFGYEEQKRIYEQYWMPIEGMFEDDPDTPGLLMDAALHAWLDANVERLDIQDRSELYSAFKRYVNMHPERELEDLLQDINASCATFASHLANHENRQHVDWAKGKLIGLVSERKLFGD